ncbi:hypothetical protein V2E25_00780 [Mycoplasmopsis arginini]|uniref:DUF31 domain-containing protein n=1 Tax=Mycoplasmopsis arginini TaxID=2094 RepID=A0ABZ2AJ35_MYCAR|nr:hypothetical protein [Mycoplasmopsis arginini]WVN22121.1 hypothetical protein V2E25_00780 [Mycoplasmopsis arginini]VEU81522.1 Uncharacterised protein [Mycoplasmopsis arginini]
MKLSIYKKLKLGSILIIGAAPLLASFLTSCKIESSNQNKDNNSTDQNTDHMKDDNKDPKPNNTPDQNTDHMKDDNKDPKPNNTPPEKPKKELQNKHFISLDPLLKMTVRDIHQKTKKYIEKNKEFKEFLRNENINFALEDSIHYNRELDKKYWSYAKELGEYGNYGNNSFEKIQYYNPIIPLGHYLKPQYLESFNVDEVQGLETQEINLNHLIKNNPFGFLPSNLSQLLSYATLDSITSFLKLNKIDKIKANVDDINGIFYLLVYSNNGKHYYKISKEDKFNNALKSNVDFYSYINDRTIELNVNVKQWVNDQLNEKNPYEVTKRLNFARFLGTAWVIDRIKNDDKENYELLLATNMHVFNLRSTFDKTFAYDKFNTFTNHDYSWYAFPPGFYDGKDTKETEDNRNKQPRPYFKINRIKENKLDLNFGIFEHIKDKYELDFSSSIETFDAYASYLDAPYYVPKYKNTHTYIKAENKTPSFLKNNYSYFETNNSGADFLTLRFKVKKTMLKNILPSLDKVINTPQEKDWYVNFATEKFSPLKTQFYAGYSRHWNPFSKKHSQFRGVKSEGGIISTKRRIIDEYYIRDSWLRYNKDLNKEYNAANDEWKKYETSFIKKNNEPDENEHGMPLTTIDQFSMLYTNIPFGDLNLKEGASGSMVIDSSFNVIGILNTRIESPGGEYKVIPFGKIINNTDGIIVREQTNGVILFKSLSDDYLEKNNSPHLIEGLREKLKKDKLETIKLN